MIKDVARCYSAISDMWENTETLWQSEKVTECNETYPICLRLIGYCITDTVSWIGWTTDLGFSSHRYAWSGTDWTPIFYLAKMVAAELSSFSPVTDSSLTDP